MTWVAPKFDKHAFAGRRAKAVSSTKTKDGWDTTGLSFADFGSMHVHRREKVQERRLPTPKWAIRDEYLRVLLVTYLEERFYVKPVGGLTLTERLEIARAAAVMYEPYKRQLLEDWLADYHNLSVNGRSDLNDEEAVALFVSLKQFGRQLPLDADVARTYLAKKKLHDLEIQIQNIDTDIVLTERGHAEVIAAIVYLYYRLGWDSVTVAEQLGLKSPHVRQVLARLHATWAASLSHLYPQVEDGNSSNPQSGDGPLGAAPSSLIPEEPFAALYDQEAA